MENTVVDYAFYVSKIAVPGYQSCSKMLLQIEKQGSNPQYLMNANISTQILYL